MSLSPIILKSILKCRKTAMNFNPPMCRAGKICIAEVEEIVDIDEIPPGQVKISDVAF